MSEMYSKERCPACKKQLFVYHGSFDDCTVQDVDGVKCPHCSYIWLLEGAELAGVSRVEDANIEEGKKTLLDREQMKVAIKAVFLGVDWAKEKNTNVITDLIVDSLEQL